MPSITSLGGVPRRELTIFYILDTSGSMSGQPIATLNTAMEETLQVLKDVAADNADAQLKIAVLEFNSNCKWMNPAGPEYVEDFLYTDLTAGGATNIGGALTELDKRLHQDGFMKSMTGAYLPIFIFMTDGHPTDNYKKALEKINGNRWFKRGCRIGFAVGDTADAGMIANICGSAEAVVQTNDLALFARLLKVASVTSSMMRSKSATTGAGGDVTGSEIISTVVEEEGIDPGTVTPEGLDPDLLGSLLGGLDGERTSGPEGKEPERPGEGTEGGETGGFFPGGTGEDGGGDDDWGAIKW